MVGNAWDFPGSSAAKESTCNAGDRSQEDSLEKEMATNSSMFAWEIPQTEEPGGLWSMRLQRVRYDLATKQQLYVK